MTRLLLTVHKWIGISLGLFLFTWLASGIIMILPLKRLAPTLSTADVDVTRAAISPAEAAAIVHSREGDSSGVQSFSISVVGREAYYRFITGAGNHILISSATGERLVIDSARAEALARAGLDVAAPVTSLVQVRKPSMEYPQGTLPVWRVEFGDGRKTVAWVGIRDGSVNHTTRLRKARSFIAHLHTFDQVRWITGSKLAQNGSLGLTSGIALLLVVTGYYLGMPRRWRRRWERTRPEAE